MRALALIEISQAVRPQQGGGAAPAASWPLQPWEARELLRVPATRSDLLDLAAMLYAPPKGAAGGAISGAELFPDVDPELLQGLAPSE